LRAVEALPPRDLLLVFEADDAEAGGAPRARRLYLSADPNAARVHQLHARVEPHDGGLGPFFRACQEALRGARLARLSQLRGDRIVLLEFRETAAGRGRSLVLELTGRRATLALLDEGERVLAALDAPVGQKVLRVQVGVPYQPPPAPREPVDASAPLAATFDTRPDATPSAPSAPSAPGARGAPRPTPATDAPLSLRVEQVLAAAQLEQRDADLRANLRERLERKLGKTRQFLKGLAVRRAACAQAERVREDGELLKSQLAALPRGVTSVELTDWFAAESGATRRVDVDPKLSAHENVERLFQRYHKLLRTAEELGADEERGERTLAKLEQLLARLVDGAPLELEAEALREGVLEAPQATPERRAEPAARLPYKVFHTAGGTEVWVGRSAEDNDKLSLKCARGNDVWLHTADSPGSHIVLRVEKGAEPDPEDLLDAAHLAVHYSPLRGARKAAVHVARCKDVHKPRGAKAGLVQLSGGRTLHLRLDDARLRRMLDTRGGPSSEIDA
jgi:predicted ribosome quality control (RQC) complex YloA/Tae2 family protein